MKDALGHHVLGQSVRPVLERVGGGVVREHVATPLHADRQSLTGLAKLQASFAQVGLEIAALTADSMTRECRACQITLFSTSTSELRSDSRTP